MKNLIKTLKKKKKDERSDSRAAWQDGPCSVMSLPSSRHFSHRGGCSPGISLLLFYHRVQPPHSLWCCKTQDCPCSLFPLCPSPGIFLPSGTQPLVYLPGGQQHPPTLPGSLLWAQSHHLGGTGCWSQQQAAQKQCQGLFIGRGLQFLVYTIMGFLHKKGEKKINRSTSVLWFKVTAICVMPERQWTEEKANLGMLFIHSPNILGYKDQTNYQTVLSWAGFTNHALLEELGENLLSCIMKGANKLFSWRVNIIKKIIFYVIFFSSLLIAAWNTFLKHNELQMNSWAINLLYMALEGKLIRWVDAITAIT